MKNISISIKKIYQIDVTQLKDELRLSYKDALETNKQRVPVDCHLFLESMETILWTDCVLPPIGFPYNRTKFDNDYSIKDKDQDF